ncbi:MAG TPA: hypothetical protein VE398_15910 [Acidobacteriota bacterium]|nr:hypothetical protein [Acidobacteriota bacterium]
MSAEAPILQAVIARLPDMQTQLAAFGIVTSLEIAIESPVIMLLATSTALATNATNYLTLRRFVFWANVLVTVVAVLMAYSPMYGIVVRRIMDIPPNIAAAARPGMKIMVLWSAAIGVRRFLQGVLIRHAQTRRIGYGTTIRLVSSGGTGIVLALLTSLPGVYIASIGLMAGVTSEMLFILVAVRPTLVRIRRNKNDASSDIVSFWDVTRYHAPLAATALLTLLAQPVISAGLARMPHPEENLAAWPVIWGILFVFRSPAFALPEAVIALLDSDRLRQSLGSFCRRVGSVASAAMLAFSITPLLGIFLKYGAGLPDHLARFVVPGLVLTIPLPFVNSIHSWIRGQLMAKRLTRVIYWGMGLNLGVITLLIAGGVFLHLPGAGVAAVALIASFLAEIQYLRRRLPVTPETILPEARKQPT